MIQFLTIYYVCINGFAFLLMAWDKKQARKKYRRISEKTFFMLCILGGYLGVYSGMLVFRHKSQKFSFQLKTLIATLLSFIIYYTLSLKN